MMVFFRFFDSCSSCQSLPATPPLSPPMETFAPTLFLICCLLRSVSFSSHHAAPQYFAPLWTLSLSGLFHFLFFFNGSVIACRVWASRCWDDIFTSYHRPPFRDLLRCTPLAFCLRNVSFSSYGSFLLAPLFSFLQDGSFRFDHPPTKRIFLHRSCANPYFAFSPPCPSFIKLCLNPFVPHC